MSGHERRGRRGRSGRRARYAEDVGVVMEMEGRRHGERGRPGPPWGFPPFFGGPFGGPPHRGGPWGGRGRKAKRGNVRAAILALLAEEPRNGYQIIQEIAERSDGAWRPSPGAVYPALQQLVDEGLIRPDESEGRKTFSLTEAGQAYVEEHADEVSAPWEAMAHDVSADVHDLFSQAAQTGAAIVQVAHAGTDAQVARARDVLAEARRKIYQILAEDAPRDEPADDTPREA